MVLPPAANTYPARPRVAVAAVVFRDHRVLLVRRGRAPARGQWAIPGGSVKLGESLQQAAEREILEETGIHIRAGAPLLTFDTIERDADGKVRFYYVIVDLSAEYLSGEPVAGDDATEARWVSFEELAQLPVNARTLDLLVQRLGFGAAMQ